jgi:hypothetical protein
MVGAHPIAVAKTRTRQNTNVKIMKPVGGFLPFLHFSWPARYTVVPPITEAEGALGATMGACLIPMGDGQTCRRNLIVFMVPVLDELVEVCCWDLCH